LQQQLLLGRQPVDACGQDRLHRGGHLNTRQRLRQAIVPLGTNYRRSGNVSWSFYAALSTCPSFSQ
jgi:hypothetical protein